MKMTRPSRLVFWLLTSLCSIIPSCANAATGSVRLAWDANSETDLAGYNLYQSKNRGGFELAQGVGKATQADIVQLSPDTEYRWYVTAYNAAGESDPSNEVAWVSKLPDPPTMPTGLHAFRTLDRLTLRWVMNPAGEMVEGYQINWIKLGATNWASLSAIGSSATFTVPPRDYLMVRVAAISPFGVGPFSELTVPGIPKAPTGLAVMADSVQWNVPP